MQTQRLSMVSRFFTSLSRDCRWRLTRALCCKLLWHNFNILLYDFWSAFSFLSTRSMMTSRWISRPSLSVSSKSTSTFFSFIILKTFSTVFRLPSWCTFILLFPTWSSQSSSKPATIFNKSCSFLFWYFYILTLFWIRDKYWVIWVNKLFEINIIFSICLIRSI